MVPKTCAAENVQWAILETVSGDSTMTLKLQSKVEHLTSIAFLLDFLTSTRASEPRKQQKIKDLIAQDITHLCIH